MACETDDPDVKAALKSMFSRFTKFIDQQVGDHRQANGLTGVPEVWSATWAIIGLATAADIAREVGLLTAPKRKALIAQAGRLLLDGVDQ